MYLCPVIMNGTNKEILKIAVPAIVTNITVPLLGLIDLSIAGHLGEIKYIGAISIGAMIFNLIYWNFAFLRMGTTGMTAQFFGSKDEKMIASTLYRALTIAVSIGLLLILFQYPVGDFALWALAPSESVKDLALQYFHICIWGAPALLTTLVIKGWLLGMQNSKYPMAIAVSINILNIFFSLMAVFVFKVGFIGIAIGTVLAEYSGTAIAVGILLTKYREHLHAGSLKAMVNGGGIGKFFKVNSDIFFRSLFLQAVTFSFTTIGARAGDVILAVNAIIMQLYLFYSYFLDGFAFAGEAIVGRNYGARDYGQMQRSVKQLFVWGAGVGVMFTAVYGFGLEYIVPFLTDDASMFNAIIDNRLWCILFPILGISAFIWDGIFIGLTATRNMLVCTLCAASGFFALYFLGGDGFSNIRLWSSFIFFLVIRGAVLAVFYKYKYSRLQ